MKKTLILVVLMLFVASPAFALITGSKHDLSAAGGVYTGGVSQASCQYCHTPHHAVSASAPLWNKTLTTTSFTLYGGGTTASNSTVSQPGDNSLTCLTCHDGTLNVGDVVTGTSDTIVLATVLTGGQMDSGADGYIGTDLADTHPVGVVYDSAKVGSLAGLNSTTAAAGSSDFTIGGKNWRIYAGDDGTGTVQCGSCHDPHNTTTGEEPFLKDTKNTICSDCHSAK